MSTRAAIALALLAASAPARGDGLTAPSFAVHVGSGGGGWSLDGRAAWFGDALARHRLRLSLAGEADGRLGDGPRLGARASTLYLGSGDAGTRTSITVGRLEALARLQPPRPLGPYAHVGLGPAFLHHRVDVPGLASGAFTAWGGSLSLAAGAFYRARDGAPELRIEAEGSAQAWLPTRDGPSLSFTFGGSAGVAW